MSNTLKLGTDGNWAAKEGSLLAYNDTNGNFKPLPFTFDRSTSATRVNKDGLIEVVSNNEPRIDFKDDANGALLLEPQRTNLIQYSESFDNSYWTKYQTSVSADSTISVDGNTNSDKIIEDTSNSTHQIGRVFSYVSGTSYTVSVFSKSNDRNLEIASGNTNTFPVKAIFDLTNGTVLSNTFGTASIENFGNGWYRCIITATALVSASTNINFGLVNGSVLSYVGNGNSFIELYGAQLEQGSYATSYIPTQGSAVTRVADVCNGAGNEQVINSTEGVLFAEISALEDSPTGYLSLSNSSSTQVRLGFLFGNLYTQIRIDNNVLYSYSENGILTQNNKLAIFWNNNTQKFFVNGFLVDTSSLDTTISANTLNKLSFDVGTGGGPFHGKVKDVRVYNQALTDQELINLTKI